MNDEEMNKNRKTAKYSTEQIANEIGISKQTLLKKIKDLYLPVSVAPRNQKHKRFSDDDKEILLASIVKHTGKLNLEGGQWVAR